MTDKYVAQVGGIHYEYGNNLSNQHWDLMDRWDIEYLAATGSKYVVRWDTKGSPVLDIGKSISYLQKQLLCRPQGCRRVIPYDAMISWFIDNGLRSQITREAEKRLLLELIHVEGSPSALRDAVKLLHDMLERENATINSQTTTLR